MQKWFVPIRVEDDNFNDRHAFAVPLSVNTYGVPHLKDTFPANAWPTVSEIESVFLASPALHRSWNGLPDAKQSRRVLKGSKT
jgi:hypothetical protein